MNLSKEIWRERERETDGEGGGEIERGWEREKEEQRQMRGHSLELTAMDAAQSSLWVPGEMRIQAASVFSVALSIPG